MKGSGCGIFILADIGLGISGALVGGFLSGALLGIPFTGFNLISLVVVLIGAIIVVAVVRAVPGRTSFRPAMNRQI